VIRRLFKTLPFRGTVTSRGRRLSSDSDSPVFAIWICTLSLLGLLFISGFGISPPIGMTLFLLVVMFAVCCRMVGLQPQNP